MFKFNYDVASKEVSVNIGSKREEIFTIKRAEEGKVVLSYTHKNIQNKYQRGSRYFEDIVLGAEEWKIAIYLALDEYFQVLIRIIDKHPNDENNEKLLGYYRVWDNLEPKTVLDKLTPASV